MTGIGLLCLAATFALGGPRQAPETQYLMFQIFVGAPDKSSLLNSAMPPSEIDTTVRDVVKRIGTVGTAKRRLGVVLGLLAFDHSDAEIRGFIRHGFEIAQKEGVAIAFHIDDSMFWAARTDIVRNPENVEWSDWSGTPSRSRSLEWGPLPTAAPPQMCFNAPEIRKEVARRAKEVFGSAIEDGRKALRRSGKDQLFVGVIAGSETQIGSEFGSGKLLGFHALANRGFSAAKPPKDAVRERELVVQEFIGLWTKNLAAAGVPTNRIYSHTAFQPGTDSARNHFAPPEVAFGETHRPGFSTYPEPGFFDELQSALSAHKHPSWASCEGTNYLPGSGDSGMTMETYLGRMFNHGASLVNIYAWGFGGAPNRSDPFRIATEREESIAAYRKFLRGETLVEQPINLVQTLPDKIHRIQRAIPAWIERTHRPDLIQPLMERLDAAIKAGKYPEAGSIADQILKLIDQPG
jgi:hypothetical protein